MAKPKGTDVKPQVLVGLEDASAQNSDAHDTDVDEYTHPDPEHMLKAYVEPIDFDEWDQCDPTACRIRWSQFCHCFRHSKHAEQLGKWASIDD